MAIVTRTGTSAADTLLGTDGDQDSISGLAGNDSLSGLAGIDSLYGGSGHDTLDGGALNDVMKGGIGNDTYIFDHLGDLITELADEGTDTILAYLDVGNLVSNIENLTLLGTADRGTGNALDNVIKGNQLANTIDGAAGADTLVGGLGNDAYYVDNALDKLVEKSGAGKDEVRSYVSWTLGANLENLSLYGTGTIDGTGNGRKNLIVGNGKANTLDGSTNADTMKGAGGDDTYYVDNAGDRVVELSSEGADKVVVGNLSSYTLAGSVENLQLGTGAVSGTGNGRDNVIEGNSGDNALAGGGGNDTLSYESASGAVTADLSTGNSSGGAGADTFTGFRNLWGSGFADSLVGSAAANSLAGMAGKDTLEGGGGNDTLDGGDGSDHLAGGSGDDLYYVGSGDTVSEAADAGEDTVVASVSYTLTDYVENLLLGAGSIDGTGNTADNVVYAGSGDNSMSGGGGTDTVSFELAGAAVTASLAAGVASGGSGADKLSGIANLAGSSYGDSFSGDGNANELSGAAGNDTLSGAAGNDTLSGGEGADSLSGGNDADELDGGAGIDSLSGGGGDDVLVFDAIDAQVSGGTGTDTLKVAGAGTGIDLTTLGDGVLADIEKIDLTGSGRNVLMTDASHVISASSTTDVLEVAGNAGDRVLLAGSGWSAGTPGADATGYTDSVTGAVVSVENDVEVLTGAELMSSTTFDGSYTTAFGFRIKGASSYDFLGYALASGDVNGDGFDDLIVTARDHEAGALSEAGSTYVVFGTATFSTRDFDASSIDGTNGFRIDGSQADNGASAVAVGDINGDGLTDIIIGQYANDTSASNGGAVSVVFGTGTGFAPVVDLSSLDGTNGFTLTGNQSSGRAGTSVAVGDIDGDGYDDIVVGAPGEKWPGVLSTHGYGGEGISYVVYGHSGSWGESSDTLVRSGVRLLGTGALSDLDTSGWASGTSVGLTDINGDGRADILVGTQFGESGGTTTGLIDVVYGKDLVQDYIGDIALGGLVLRSLSSGEGMTLIGHTSSAQAGQGVSSAGDVNGDGIEDLIVSSGTSAFVVFGSTSGFGTGFNLSAVDGTTGFQISLHASASGVSAAGDVNGDGYGDLLVGDPLTGVDGYAVHWGEGYVIFGKADGFSALIEKADINGTNGFVFVSEQSKTGRFGAAAAAGDLNGDGFDDLVFGAPTLSTTSTISNIEKGAAYVLYGRDFTGAVDDAGTSGDDSLSGTAAGESLIGGLGADTLTGGGGEDVLYGASGDDLIEVANLSFRLIDGGLGADELLILGAGRSLDLTAMSDLTITGIERIDIDGSGANSIKLAQRDVLALGDGNQVVIDGGSDDSVDFVGTWSTNGIADGDGYYHYTSGAATVLIDSDLTIG